ncbi:MAG: N-alpha-acetyltransferase mak3 [Cirrosporium novae-zelandiae]|nr:MAG: N-alpha-acetyltransferase mak3 [Cirrosporium novae-zelandiae]
MSGTSDIIKSPKPAEIHYVRYQSSKEPEYLPAIRRLISKDLSEPYSIFALDDQNDLIGVVVSKLEHHRGGPLRGYIAMLATKKEHRGKGIATKLVRMAIDAMIERNADEVALETEVDNTAAMRLYERLGFLRSKRLHRYYLNGNSAFRLLLHLKEYLGIPADFTPIRDLEEYPGEPQFHLQELCRD